MIQGLGCGFETGAFMARAMADAGKNGKVCEIALC
jgi:hypothetical protein